MTSRSFFISNIIFALVRTCLAGDRDIVMPSLCGMGHSWLWLPRNHHFAGAHNIRVTGTAAEMYERHHPTRGGDQ